ncbi:MAG: hypothetical protein ABIO48_15720 [Pedococcus sp.]
MRLTWRDRHTVAAGAAACAVCCAAPVLGLLGIGVGGAAATAFAAVFAGSVFALVVAVVSVAVFWRRHSRRNTSTAPAPSEPTPVTLGQHPPD